MDNVQNLQMKVSESKFIQMVQDLIAREEGESRPLTDDLRETITKTAADLYQFVQAQVNGERLRCQQDLELLKKYVRRRFYSLMSFSESKLDAIAYRLSPDGQ